MNYHAVSVTISSNSDSSKRMIGSSFRAERFSKVVQPEGSSRENDVGPWWTLRQCWKNLSTLIVITVNTEKL